MARTPRMIFPGAICHVYCRTARGEMVFSDPLEASECLDLLAEARDCGLVQLGSRYLDKLIELKTH